MAPPFRNDPDGLLAVADRHEKATARTIEALLVSLRANLPQAEVQRLLEAGHVFDLEDRIPWADVFAVPVTKSLGDDTFERFLSTMVDAAAAVGEHPELFTITNPYAVAAARRQAADLVVQVRDSTRRAVRHIVTSSVRGNYTPQQAARLISNVVGLDPRRAQALANYDAAMRRVVEGRAPRSTLRRAGLRTPGDLRRGGADRAVARYSNRLLRDRAETIARTEVMTAANRGLQESWAEAVRAGLMDVHVVRREWVVTYDDRTCEACAPMGGQVVGFDAPFVSSLRRVGGEDVPVPVPTTTVTPPLHPRCRCTMILLMDWTGTAVA